MNARCTALALASVVATACGGATDLPRVATPQPHGSCGAAPEGADSINDFEGITEGARGGVCVPFVGDPRVTSIAPPPFVPAQSVEGDCAGEMAFHIAARNVTTAAGVNCELGTGMAVDGVWLPKDFDISQMRALTFAARVEVASETKVRVSIMDGNNHPAGGVCNDSASECYNFFGVDLVLSSTWRRYVVPLQGAGWTQVTGFGRATASPDLSRVYGVQFAFQGGGRILPLGELWLDDVAWVK